MHFDTLCLACVVNELNVALVGGRVQQVVLPDERSVGLEVYANGARRYLLLSGEPGAGRAHLCSVKLRRGVERESPLLLLLRKYVRGAALAAVVQEDVFERVAYLEFDHPEHGVTRLVVEPMGRLSNVLLLDVTGKILECLLRVPPSERAQRVLLPGRMYVPPPEQTKLPPLDDGTEGYIEGYYERLGEVVRAPGRLWQALVDQVAGMSPTLGREVAWRAAGDVNAAAESVPVLAVAQALQAVWEPVRSGGWEPGLIMESGAPVGFAACAIHFRGEFVATGTLSEALERFFAGREEAAASTGVSAKLAGGPDAYAAMREVVANRVATARRRLQRQIEGLNADEPEEGAAERLRRAAEWLLALSSQVSPGQRVLEVDLGEGESLSIPLEEGMSPVEQAQEMFRRAAKMERAGPAIRARRAKLEDDLAFVEQLDCDLSLAGSQPEIAAVEEELRRAGLFSEPGQARKRAAPRGPLPGVLRFVSPDGFEVLVGRSARQNEAVTFDLARADDAWLHARGVPGAHVVVRGAGRTISEDALRFAAQLAAYYSRLRGERAADVMVTRRRFVGRVPGGRPGQVTVDRAETLTVTAIEPEGAKEAGASFG